MDKHILIKLVESKRWHQCSGAGDYRDGKADAYEEVLDLLKKERVNYEKLEDYHVVKYGKNFLKGSLVLTDTDETGVVDVEVVYKETDFESSERCTYEQADRLAKLYGGKVKKVVTYIEDVEAYS